MRRQILTAALLLGLASGHARAQTLTTLKSDWGATFTALQSGDTSAANAAFARFNLALRSYAANNRVDWRTEYLAGSLDCQFPDYRILGAQVLKDILQNNRALNPRGNAEVSHVLAACQAPLPSSAASAAPPPIPANLLDASAHFTQPGVSGNTKMGDSYRSPTEFHSAVATVSPAELEARRVPVTNPQAALDHALKSIGQPSAGITRGGFAVAELRGTRTDAEGVADCLARYAAPMKAEFQIEPSVYMMTAYVVPDRVDVYEMARRLHGLVLPSGVIAYSVPEDMSLTSQGEEFDCGSMAHEMVHLLIKDKFPGAPAWLEEGLASEVAVANPTPEKFVFGWSWRDAVLFPGTQGRPTLNELLDMSWADFSEDPDYPTSYIQATAAVFVRYLDHKGMLQPVYFEVRDHHLTADFSVYRSYPAILEDVLHKPLAAIQADFDTWFAEQYRINNPGSDKPTGPRPPVNGPGPLPAANQPPAPSKPH